MCRYFKVTKIVVTTGPATGKGHEGEPYTNPDFPAGSVLAWDRNGDLYTWRGPNPVEDAWSEERAKSYSRNTRPLQMYRDYWSIVEPSPGSPYRRAIEGAPHRVFWQSRHWAAVA